MKIDIALEPNVSGDEFARLGRLAESYDLGTVWTANILASRDPFLCFSRLARESHDIRMGPMAISPFEMHPVRMANLLFTLNEFSRGRADIVVGGGGGTTIALKLKPDRRTMFPKMVRGVRECVDILKGVSPDKPLMYDGELFQVMGYQPEWATDPPPRIYVGATGRQMLKMATAAADGVMMSDVPLQRIDETIAWICGHLSARGRPRGAFRINNLLPWHVKADAAAARREALRKIWVRGMLSPWHISKFLDEDDSAFVEDHFDSFAKAYMANTHEIEGVPDRILDKLVENLTLTGDLGDVDRLIEELDAFKRAGVSEFTLRIYDDPAASIKLIGERVAPAVR